MVVRLLLLIRFFREVLDQPNFAVVTNAKRALSTSPLELLKRQLPLFLR